MSGYIVPALAALLILYGLVKRIDVYEAFAEGAAEGLPVLVHILPYLAAMLIAVRLLTDGGLLDGFARLLAPACAALNMDAELMPLLLVRPFSGSGAMAMLKELFAVSGVDSRAGYVASVAMGSSETIFYEMALYFGVVRVKKMRYAAPVALAAGAVSTALAIVLGSAFR